MKKWTDYFYKSIRLGGLNISALFRTMFRYSQGKCVEKRESRCKTALKRFSASRFGTILFPLTTRTCTPGLISQTWRIFTTQKRYQVARSADAPCPSEPC